MTDFRPGLLDRALLAVAPEYGLRRLRARMAADFALRAYDGAKTDRRLGNWTASGSSANTETRGANDRLRFRARDLERNNRLVFSAMQQFAGQVVGTGIVPRATHKNVKVRKLAADAWARFADTCDPEGQQDFYGLQHQTARTVFRDGEVLHRWLPVGNVPNAQIRVLEVDHLDGAREIMATPGRRTVQGIEFDDAGRRQNYWIFPVHPGETGWIPTRAGSVAVPAADVDHYFHAVRPGQARGVSWLAPSIVALRGLDDIQEAMIWRKRLEACIGLVLGSPDIQGAAPVIGKQRSDGDNGRIIEKVSPGMVLRTGPGESVNSFQPSVSNDTIEFIRSELYAFCATTGIPYHAITGDVSQANYSSLRAATIAGHVVLDLVQWLVMAPRLKAAHRRVMESAALVTGELRLLEVGCALAMPIRPWVDPVKDITAKVLEIRAGLQSMPDAMAERGFEWTELLAEIEMFLKASDRATIILDTDARTTTHSGQMQAAAAIALAPDPAKA